MPQGPPEGGKDELGEREEKNGHRDVEARIAELEAELAQRQQVIQIVAQGGGWENFVATSQSIAGGISELKRLIGEKAKVPA